MINNYMNKSLRIIIRLPLVLAVGFISMLAAALLGVVIVSFDILDIMLTPIIRKSRKKKR